MRYCYLILFTIILISCSRNNKDADLVVNKVDDKKLFIEKINTIEDSLASYYRLMVNNRADSLPSQMISRAIKLYESFYRQFPNDSLTPVYLDKIHQLHTQEKRYLYAVNWVDTLMSYYPNYANKAEVLYSAATTSDLYLLDTNRVKRYYETLLQNCPQLKEDVKLEVKKRLKNLKYPYLDYLKISSTSY